MSADPLVAQLRARGITPLAHVLAVYETGGQGAVALLVRQHPEVVLEAWHTLAPGAPAWLTPAARARQPSLAMSPEAPDDDE